MPGHWTDLFRRQLRPVLIVGLGLAIFQQITGINTVIYYAPTILEAAGFNSASGGILATVGVGVVNVAMTVVAMLTFLTLVEKLGASSTFLLYASASVASWLFAYYFVPGTKGRTLEQIEAFWRARHGVRQEAPRIA
jgi:MFS family permease